MDLERYLLVKNEESPFSIIRRPSDIWIVCTMKTGTDDSDNKAPPKFPTQIFFDTNVVQNLCTFGELVYDGFLSEETATKLLCNGQRFSGDIFALKDFMGLGQRVGWPIAVSANTLDELVATLHARKRVRLLSWGVNLTHYFREHSDQTVIEPEEAYYNELRHYTSIQRYLLSEILKELPQESDRQLVIDAREYGCDIFLTMDYKTIWKHRACVEPLGILVMRPVELMEYIRPWAGLLR